MRALRLFAAFLLALAGLSAVASVAAGAADPTYTALTGSGLPDGQVGGPFVLTGAEVQVQAGAPTASITVTATPTPGSSASGYGPVTAYIAPPMDAALQAGVTYDTSRSPSPSQILMDISTRYDACSDAAPGTLDVLQVGTDEDGNINQFAADYTYGCTNTTPISGSIRWNASEPFPATDVSPNGWDFGSQLVKATGIARTFTVHNWAATPQTYTKATIEGTTSAYSITGNTCKVAVPSGGHCTITVVPHPQTLGYTGSSGPGDSLRFAAIGGATFRIGLAVLGSQTPQLYLEPGAGHITVNWGALATPYQAGVTGYRIYRGPSATNLSYLRGVKTYASGFVNYDVTPGRAYYYAMQPVFSDGSTGYRTPVAAAEAWPTYAAGRYHRLTTPTRFLNAHAVAAGHPYSLKVLGVGGVPSSGVAAVAVDIEATHPSQSTSVWAYPSGTSRPAAADMVARAGHARTDFAIVKIGSGGRILLATSHGRTDISIDVSGYFSAAGLAAKYGSGGALQESVAPGTILNTNKAYGGHGALPGGYYLDDPVAFTNPSAESHIKSFVVEITAYGSAGSGTIRAFRTGGSIPKTVALDYAANATTTNTAIVPVGQFYNSRTGQEDPSVSFANFGSKAVQLHVSLLGYFDDNTFVYGQTYTPTAPVHLLSRTMYAGGDATFSPGSHGNRWTTAFAMRIAASNPTATTQLSLRAIGGGAAPTDGQLHASAKQSTIATSLVATGVGNKMGIHNSAGRVTVSLWSFGRFDAFPQPSTLNFIGGSATAARTAVRAVSSGAARAVVRRQG